MADTPLINIEVAYATPEQQRIIPLRVPAGTTIADAIRLSAVETAFPSIDIHPDRVGVFSIKQPMDYVLSDGDRVEIYRPLQADPKEVRRQRAEANKTRSE